MIKKSLFALLLTANLCNAMQNRELLDNTCIERDEQKVGGLFSYTVLVHYTRYHVGLFDKKTILEAGQKKERLSWFGFWQKEENFCFSHNAENLSQVRSMYNEAALDFLLYDAIGASKTKFAILEDEYNKQQRELGSRTNL